MYKCAIVRCTRVFARFAEFPLQVSVTITWRCTHSHTSSSNMCIWNRIYRCMREYECTHIFAMVDRRMAPVCELMDFKCAWRLHIYYTYYIRGVMCKWWRHVRCTWHCAIHEHAAHNKIARPATATTIQGEYRAAVCKANVYVLSVISIPNRHAQCGEHSTRSTHSTPCCTRVPGARVYYIGWQQCKVWESDQFVCLRVCAKTMLKSELIVSGSVGIVSVVNAWYDRMAAAHRSQVWPNAISVLDYRIAMSQCAWIEWRARWRVAMTVPLNYFSRKKPDTSYLVGTGVASSVWCRAKCDRGWNYAFVWSLTRKSSRRFFVAFLSIRCNRSNSHLKTYCKICFCCCWASVCTTITDMC